MEIKTFFVREQWWKTAAPLEEGNRWQEELPDTWQAATDLNAHSDKWAQEIEFCCSYCGLVLIKCLMCCMLEVPKFYVLSTLVVLM